MNLARPPHSAEPVTTQEAALHKRYREDVPGIGTAWNSTLDVLLAHRSVRAYLPEPLPHGTIETLVAAAQSASTSSNVQAWSVVVVEDEQRKARIAKLAGDQQHIIDAPLLLVWVADLSRIGEMGAERGSDLEGLDYTETFLIATVDAALAAQNAATAAESLGLGIVYIGGLRNHPVELAEEVGLPPRAYAVFGMTVGRPDPARSADIKPRLPQQAVLHRERYSREAQSEAIARHDDHARAFRAEQRLSPQPWSDLAVRRLSTVAGLKGREVLRDCLEKFGFPLK